MQAQSQKVVETCWSYTRYKVAWSAVCDDTSLYSCAHTSSCATDEVGGHKFDKFHCRCKHGCCWRWTRGRGVVLCWWETLVTLAKHGCSYATYGVEGGVVTSIHVDTWFVLRDTWGGGVITSVALAHMVGTIYATHVVGDEARCDSMCSCTHGWCYTILHGVGCGVRWG